MREDREWEREVRNGARAEREGEWGGDRKRERGRVGGDRKRARDVMEAGRFSETVPQISSRSLISSL